MNKLLLIFSFHSLVSIFSVIYLNLIFFCYRFILKKKIIFFYHPKTNLVKIHEYYINDLFNQIRKDYKVIYGIQPEKNFKISVKKSFFIKQGLLKWLLNIDIFISQNVCDVFTNKSKRIYIHHCVYDTPLASKIKEKKLVQRLSMYDHILLSSKDAENIFNRLFLRKKNKKPKLHILGYPKLDFLTKKNSKVKKVNSIVLAPTGIKSFPNLSMQKNIIKIIKTITKLKKFNLIYRPHPSDFLNKRVKYIENYFKNNNFFKLDRSENYFYNYKSSKLLITDLSGTSYTYAFLTNNPVIFFSKNEKYIKNTYYKDLNFFKNRNKIGLIVKKEKYLLNAISKVEIKKKIFQKNIGYLKQNIKNLGRSKNKILNLIYDIC